MTAKREICAPAPRTLSPGTIAFSLMSALAFFLIFFCGETAVTAMKSALALCVQRVIPSLFPFMVVSELIVHSGVGELLGRLSAPLLRRLLRVSKAGGSVILLGVLCGFPIGAKSAATLYDEGRLSARELSFLLCLCNQPSSAFVTGIVGISLFRSYRFGLLLWGITLLSALLVGLICRLLLSGDTKKADTPTKQKKSATPSISLFTQSVANAAGGMLTVCAFVCFFGTLVACLSALPAMSSLPAPISALLVGIFELTGGVARAASLSSPTLAAYTAAWCLGWSGLSVHFQIMCLCQRKGVSFRPYFAAKMAQGIMNVALLFVVLRLWPSLLPCKSVPSGVIFDAKSTWQMWCILTVFGVFVFLWRWGKRKKNTSKIRQKSHVVGEK